MQEHVQPFNFWWQQKGHTYLNKPATERFI